MADKKSANRGSSLVAIMVILVALSSLTISGLVSARWAISLSTNYQNGLQALHAAEAGALHAQNTINSYGVIDFSTDVVANWGSLFGTSSRQIPGYSSITYSATVASDPVNSSAYVLLTAVGQAPGESQRTIQARLGLDGAYSAGAIYLPNAGVSTNFNGTNFMVDGNDTNLDGSRSSSDAVPGIGTSTASDATSVIDNLTPQQEPRVIGAGGTPSVAMSAGPTMQRLDDEIIPHILAQPGVVTNPALNGNDTFGTVQYPQITHFSGSVTINGNLAGAGILIVDNALTISGSATFTGLIIVRGTTEITAASGNATLLGAIWTTNLQLIVSGSSSVTYSREALAVANVLATSGLLPQRVHVVSWYEQ